MVQQRTFLLFQPYHSACAWQIEFEWCEYTKCVRPCVRLIWIYQMRRPRVRSALSSALVLSVFIRAHSPRSRNATKKVSRRGMEELWPSLSRWLDGTILPIWWRRWKQNRPYFTQSRLCIIFSPNFTWCMRIFNVCWIHLVGVITKTYEHETNAEKECKHSSKHLHD